MRTIDAVRLHHALRRWQQMSHPDVPIPVRLGFAIEMNLRATQALAEAYAKFADPMQDTVIAAYEQDRRAALEKLGRRDADGNLVVLPSGDVEVANRKALDKEIAALRRRHPAIDEAVAAFNARVRELDAEEVALTLRTVPVDLLPEKLAPAVLAGVLAMVEDA